MSAMVVRPGGLTRLVVAAAAVFVLAGAAHGGLGALGAGGGSTSSGANVKLGKSMAAAAPYHWTGGQFTCLNELWTRESGWSTTALNSQSGATGIPQLLPSAHAIPAGWGNASTEIAWGLGYIQTTYQTPCGAWAHETQMGWY